MDKKNSPNMGHNKKKLLNNPIEHIDIKSDSDVKDRQMSMI